MKLYAINENHLFSKVYTKGKRAVTRTVCVYILPDYHASRLQRAHPLKLRINRVGLTVTKKLGGAPLRNRAKRVMREAYYKAQKEYTLKTGQLVVIAARGPATEAKTDEVFKDLTEALRKTGMIVE